MSRDPDNTEDLISTKEIARRTGKTLSTISNWRNRYPDFPQPVPETPGRTRYFQVEEVEAWLAKQGRAPLRQTSSPQAAFEAAAELRGSYSTEQLRRIICAAITGIVLKDGGAGTTAVSSDGVTATGIDLLAPLASISKREVESLDKRFTGLTESELADSFEWAINHLDGIRGGVHQSSAYLLPLLSKVFQEAKGTFLDPACGLGGFLIEAARLGRLDLKVIGIDVNEDSARLASQRAVVHGLRNWEVYCADSLAEDPVPGLQAETVACDPPWGLRRDWAEQTLDSSRWLIPPRGKDADLAWVQLATTSLKPGGRAVVFSPISTFFRSGSEASVRQELLRVGAIETLVQLAPEVTTRSALPTAIWVTRHPAAGDSDGGVRLVDAARLPSPGDVDESTHPRKKSRSLSTATIADLLAGGSTKDLPGTEEISPLELMKEGINLTPRLWLVTNVSESEREESRNAMGEASSEVNGLLAQGALLELDIDFEPEDSIASVSTIEELIRSGQLKRIRRSSPDDSEGHPTRSLTLSSLMEGDPDAPEIDEIDDKVQVGDSGPADADGEGPSRPGDLIFGGLGQFKEIWIEQSSGRYLERPLTGLRIVGEWISPELLARLIKSAAPLVAFGSTIQRTRLESIPIPIPVDSSQERVELLLTKLTRIQNTGQALAKGSSAAEQSLLTLMIGAGR